MILGYALSLRLGLASRIPNPIILGVGVRWARKGASVKRPWLNGARESMSVLWPDCGTKLGEEARQGFRVRLHRRVS